MFAILIIATIAGIVLKLTEVIDWAWPVVLIPAFCLAAFTVIYIVLAITGASVFRRESKRMDREFDDFGKRNGFRR